jgi:hypothetical protein
MLLSHHFGTKQARGRVERIDGRINAQLEIFPAQHGGGIQVREGSSRSRVGKVVGRHIYGLYDVIEPLLVEVIRSCIRPISVASVG